ncbi:MAG: hypothetical protein WCP18_02320 [bacterium]
MAQITNDMEWLLDIFSHPKRKPTPPDVEKIKLNQLISKLGFFYEKFRNAIDYNEEHLLRRVAIERILRRHILFLQERRAPKIAKTLVYEFIRAKYLPNNELPESIIDELSVTLEKYLNIINYIFGSQLPEARKLAKWTIDMASCEINEQLNPIDREMAIANMMYSHLVDNLTFIKTDIDEKEKNLQIYLAVLKNLLKADLPALRYALLKLHLPNWKQLDQSEIRSFCHNISIIKNKIDKHLAHPLNFQLSRTIRPQSVFFATLKEVIEKNNDNAKEVLSDPDILEEKIEDIALLNYQRIRGKLIGTIFRVIIYILLTKTTLAFILELPYDLVLAGKINWYVLAINVIFHPLLMLLVALTIRVPGIKNTQIIVGEIKKIVYGEPRKIVFKPKNSLRPGSFAYFIFNFVYLVMFAISFGIVFGFLKLLHFNILSGILFIFFLSIVSFFGFRLRNIALQLSVIPRKDNFTNFIVDFLSLPVIRVGRFFSNNFSRINIFLYIFDFIIETPFKMLIEFLENAVSFINDKREEIIE